MSRFVKSPKLRVMLSFHPLLIGGNPFRAPAIYCLIPDLERRWGVHYPMGGVGQLVDGLVDLIGGQGGTVRYNANVERIVVEDGRARGVDAGGRRDASPPTIVVSNADAALTYGKLVDRSEKTRWGAGKHPARALLDGPVRLVFRDARRYDAVGHHTILLGPRYRELLHDIFERKRLTEDFSIYLHRPSATDPSVAPPGCDAFYALCPVPNLDGDIDWDDRRRATAAGRDAAAVAKPSCRAWSTRSSRRPSSRRCISAMRCSPRRAPASASSRC